MASAPPLTQPGGGPFIGPYPFPPGRTLFGRDREVLALSSQLTSERVVLLYSPSGAGKTSLIQAALLPRMADKGFLPLPVIRLNQPPPGPGINRYLYSALRSLLPWRSEDLGGLCDPVSPGSPSPLEQGLREAESRARTGAPPRRRGGSRPILLVFDQFEEVLTLAPDDLDSRYEFLQQLGQALSGGERGIEPDASPDRDAAAPADEPHKSERWALVAMREDRAPELEPYFGLLPGRLAASFRLDLLRESAARAAIEGPLKEVGASIDPDALDQLVGDLAGRIANRNAAWPGPAANALLESSIEPLHLQLTCQMLWDGKDKTATPVRITRADVEAVRAEGMPGVTGVTASLLAYYDKKLADLARDPGWSVADERAVRDWFDTALLSPQGARLLAPEGLALGQGLTTGTLLKLEAAYLVRAESRHGERWYELAHDRFVEPVRFSNAAWRDRNLKRFQRQADLWKRAGKSSDLLVLGEVLHEGERLEKQSPALLSPDDRAFLKACRERRSNRTRWRVFLSLVVALALAVVALAGYIAWKDAAERAAEAERNSKEARARVKQQEEERKQAGLQVTLGKVFDEVSRARALLPDSPEESARNGREALRLAEKAAEENKPAEEKQSTEDKHAAIRAAIRTASDVLREALSLAMMKTLGRHAAPVQDLLLDPRGRWLLSRAADGSVRVWPLQGATPATGADLNPGRAFITQVVRSTTGDWIITGDDGGMIRFWDVAKLPPKEAAASRYAGSSAVTALGVNPPLRGGKRRLVAGFANGDIVLLDLDSRKPVQSWKDPKKVAVRAVALSPNATQVLACDINGLVTTWSADAPAGPSRPDGSSRSLGKNVTALAVSPYNPDEQILWLAVGTTGEGVRAARLDPRTRAPLENPRPLKGRSPSSGSVTALAFSSNGLWLVAANSELGAELHRVSDREILSKVTLGGYRSITSSPYWVIRGRPTTALSTVAFSADSNWLIAGSGDGSARVWQVPEVDRGALEMGGPVGNAGASGGPTAPGLVSAISAVALGNGGGTAYTGSMDGKVRSWDLARARDPKRAEPVWSLDEGRPRWLDTVAVCGARHLRNGSETLALGGPLVQRLYPSFKSGDVIIYQREEKVAASLRRLRTGRTDPVTALAFLKDGSLATGGEDGTVRVLPSGKSKPEDALVLFGPPSAVVSLNVLDNGKLLRATWKDGAVRTWTLGTNDLLRKANKILGPASGR